MRRFWISSCFLLALPGVALSADLAGAQPICNPVASWTNEVGAVCIKYLCPDYRVQIRCVPPPALRFGPRGRNPYNW
jgi:hypothetical protein